MGMIEGRQKASGCKCRASIWQTFAQMDRTRKINVKCNMGLEWRIIWERVSDASGAESDGVEQHFINHCRGITERRRVV